MKRKFWKRVLAGVLSCLMVINGETVTAFAGQEPVAVREQIIEDGTVTDGMFYFAQNEVSIPENDSTPYRIYVRRSGEYLPEAEVKVTLLDLSASYGKDYRVATEASSLFESGVSNEENSSSIMDYIEDNREEAEEYNYSDAVIDGSVTSADQISGDPELSESEREELASQVEEVVEALLGNDVSISSVNYTTGETENMSETPESAEASDNSDSSGSADPSGPEEAFEPEEADGPGEISETAEVEEVSEVTGTDSADMQENADAVRMADFSSLAGAKAYATGLPDDRTEPLTSYESGISGITDLSTDCAAYMNESVDILGSALSSAYVILSFKEGENEKYLDIQAIDNSRGEGDKIAGFSLFAVNDEVISGLYGSFRLNIVDDEEYETPEVGFSESEYVPKDGYITAVIRRSGNLTGVSTVMLDTEEVTAIEGLDYSGVHAQVVFPMGLSERTVKIPVISTYLTGDVTFRLKLGKPENALTGMRASAGCTIRTTDVSFETETVTEGEGVAENETVCVSDAGLLRAGGGLSLSSVVVAENPMNTSKATKVYTLGADSWHSYDKDSNTWTLYLRHGTSDVSGLLRFDTPAAAAWQYERVDITGFRINSDKSYGSGYMPAKFQVCENLLGYDRHWKTFYENSNSWDWGERDYFFKNVICCGVGFDLYKADKRGYKQVELKVNTIKPIYRLFEVALDQPAPVKFVDADGKTKPNTGIDGLHQENEAMLDGAVNGSLITTSGGQILVKLPYAKYTEITGLEAVSWDGKKTWSISGVKISGQTASFTLTASDLIWFNSFGIVNFKDNPQRTGTVYGQFKIRPILAPKKTTVKVKKDDRLDITVTGATKKKTQSSGSYTEYTCNTGDIVRYTLAFKNTYAPLYTWNQLDIVNTVTGKKEAAYRQYANNEPLNYAWSRAGASSIEVSPSIAERNNTVLLKVSKSLYDKGAFNKNNPLFKNPNRTISDSSYYYFTIDSDADRIPGHEYTLSATVTDRNTKPKWSMACNSKVFYCQNDFYVTGAKDKSQNIVVLDLWTKDKLQNTVIKGKVFYEDRILGGDVSVNGWSPAGGSWFIVDRENYGIVDDKGDFRTPVIRAVSGSYVRCKVETNGRTVYEDVKISSNVKETVDIYDENGKKTDSVTAYVTDRGQSIAPAQGTDRIHLSTVISFQRTDGNRRDDIIIGARNISVIEASVALIDPSTLKQYEYSYTDSKGNRHTEKETVTNVQFFAVDPVTHEVKSTYEAESSTGDPSRWTLARAFQPGNYAEYQSGDILYARLVTDRKPDGADASGLGNLPCYYGMVNTGIVFREEQPQPKPLIDIDFEEFYPGDTFHNTALLGAAGTETAEEILSGDAVSYALPYIGKLNMFIKVSKLAIGVEPLPNGGLRFSFGKALNSPGNAFDAQGKARSDAKIVHTLGDTLEYQKQLKQIQKETGVKQNIKPVSVGVPVWSVTPIMGIYLDFVPVRDAKDGVTRTAFAGGGGFVGCLGNVRYTQYFVVYGIPFYVGGEISASVLTEFGVALKEGTEITYDNISQEFVDRILKGSEFQFVIRSNIAASAYAGVGICHTLGVRGGFQLSLNFIVNPLIKNVHPQVSPLGMTVDGAIQFWADLVLLTVPIPVYKFNLVKNGYYKDIESIDTAGGSSAAETESSLLTSAESSAGIRKKERSTEESRFVANDAENGGTLLSGSGDSGSGAPVYNRSQHVYNTEESTILENAYDAPQQKLLNFTDSAGSEKVLMTYIDDAKTRPDNERTVLMYTVYDAESGEWTEPEAVWDDDTADFGGELCDTENGIRIFWTSRKTAADPDNYSEALSSMEIFTAEFDKDTCRIAEESREQLTEDTFYDTTPTATFDSESGDILVAYMKSEVPAGITEPEDFLKAANPERNNCQIMYLIRHDGVWVRDGYFDGELAAGADPAKLLNVFKGQRFLASPIPEEGINNPVISDLCITTVNMKTAETEEGDYETTPMGVFVYSVDLDGNLDTDVDKELFIQLYDYTTHLTGTPVRLTDNMTADTLPQIAKCGGQDLLFFLSGADTIKRISLTDVYLESEKGKYTGEIPNAGTDLSSDLYEGVSVSSFRVYAEESAENPGGYNYYIAWTENPDVNEEKTGDYSREIHISANLAHGRANENDITVYGGNWSDGVRITGNGKLNELPEFSSLKRREEDGTVRDGVMMVGSRYDLLSQGEGESYRTENAELVSMKYIPEGILTLESVTADTIPAEAGEEYSIRVAFRNTGFRAVEGFAYWGSLWLADDVELKGDISGVFEETVMPGNSAEIFIPVTQSEAALDRIQEEILVLTTVDVSSYTIHEHVFGVSKEVALTDLSAEQEGDFFAVSGIIRNTTVQSLGDGVRLKIFENGREENVLFESGIPELLDTDVLPTGRNGAFELRIPIDPELAPYGVMTMVAVIESEDDEIGSVWETVTGAVEKPFGIRVNGLGNGDSIRLKKGETVNLSGEYELASIFRNAEVICSTEDPAVAGISGNALLGIKEGSTVLHATAAPFGGDTEITVIVGEGKEEPQETVSSGKTVSVPQGPESAERMTGRWVQNADRSWTFKNPDGSNFTGWGYQSGVTGWNYYHISADGIMDSGWYYDTADRKWYYLNEKHDGTFGAMVRGWAQDPQDGRWYFLSVQNGAMMTGWQKIGGAWYYLNPAAAEQTWVRNTDGSWKYSGAGRPSGSLYVDEMTPDGFRVGADGAWTGE